MGRLHDLKYLFAVTSGSTSKYQGFSLGVHSGQCLDKIWILNKKWLFWATGWPRSNRKYILHITQQMHKITVQICGNFWVTQYVPISVAFIYYDYYPSSFMQDMIHLFLLLIWIILTFKGVKLTYQNPWPKRRKGGGGKLSKIINFRILLPESEAFSQFPQKYSCLVSETIAIGYFWDHK